MTSAKLSFTTYYEITEIHILIQVQQIEHFFHHHYQFATDAGTPFTHFLGLQALEKILLLNERVKNELSLIWPCHGMQMNTIGHNFVLIATIH